MKTELNFKGVEYILNQCQESLYEFTDHSKVGEFTHYFDRIVFHTGNGFVAAYADDLSNCVNI
jgi:hypothetical protein